MVSKTTIPGRLNAAAGSGVSSTLGCMPTGVALMITSAGLLPRIDQLIERQPTSSASRVARSSWRLAIVTMRAAAHQTEGDRPRHSPGAQDQHLLFEKRTGLVFTVAAPHGGFERIHRRPIIGVIADPLAILLKDDRVAASRPIDGPFFLLQERHDRFFVRDRHAAALDVQPEQLFEKGRQLAVGTRNGTITLFRPSFRNAALCTAGLRLCSIGSPITP